jgi:amino acid efflux transporter
LGLTTVTTTRDTAPTGDTSTGEPPPSGTLRRLLGTRELTVYYLSSLVGAGILVVPGIALEIAGPASLVAWAVLSLATFPIAGVFARFSAQYPHAGGVSYLIRLAFGWRAGTSFGLFLLLLNLAANPILGLAAARYLATLFGWTDRSAVLAAGFAVMSIAVLLNMAGILIASRVQLALVVGLAVGLLVVIAVTLPAAEPGRLTPFAPHGWTAIGAAIVVCFFSFFGWESVAHVADEVREPRRSYPRAAMLAAGLLGILYCTLALVLALVVPADAANKAAALSAMLQFSHGDAASKVGAVFAVLLLVVTANAWVCGVSRLFYSMAKDRIVPHRISRVSGRNGAPLAALALTWLAYLIDFVVLYAIGGDESNLIAFTAASILLVYVATFLAGIRLFADRRTRLLCGLALAAVTAFLLGGGLPSVLAVAAYLMVLGVELLRRPPDPAAPTA